MTSSWWAAAMRRCRAAVTARRGGRGVLLLEHAPKAMRGGNSRHTRNMRAMHTAPTSVLTERYLEDEYWDDLLRVTGGQTDEQLARMTIRATAGRLPFMERCGVHFQPSLDRHAQPVAHQRLLSRRRQGAGQRLLRHRRSASASRAVRYRGGGGSSRRRLGSQADRHQQGFPAETSRAKAVIAAVRRVPGEYRVAEAESGARPPRTF